METTLIIIFVSISIATVINIVLKKLSISHIIGYIFTGIIVSSYFHFNGSENLHALESIAEFGIVFLMFTIGLEMSIAKIKNLYKVIFFNGFLQVTFSAILIYLIATYAFHLNSIPSLIISLAFSLSSTAIVLPYLKKSKDIYTPYGERATAILIFQDIAVIPILLLIQFLSEDNLNISEVLIKTGLSAIAIIIFMFTAGKFLVSKLLSFSSKARIEELFMGSILSIVLGASILADQLGFTYSLGAFIAGMIISETHYHVKVESDIASYKDILLGAFFFSIGTKIDVAYFINNLLYVFIVLLIAMLVKALVVFAIIKVKLNKSDSIKTALALSQIGEFTFAIFSISVSSNIIPQSIGNMLILVTVLSMIVAPLIIGNIYKIASYFVVEFYESDKITPIQAKNHIVICGFSVIGRIVAKELESKGVQFVIISDNLQHVLLARERGYMAYFGHLEKLPVLESLKIEESAGVIITVSEMNTKKIICEAVHDYYPKANLIVKINKLQEKEELKNIGINSFVHTQYEAGVLLAKQATTPQEKPAA